MQPAKSSSSNTKSEEEILLEESLFGKNIVNEIDYRQRTKRKFSEPEIEDDDISDVDVSCLFISSSS